MNRKFHKTLALLPLAAACAAFGTVAQAQVTFSGAVVSGTCQVAILGGNTVALTPITSDQFPNVGDAAGLRSFTVRVTGCGNTPGVTAKVHFHAPAANVSGGRLKPTLANAGWEFQLYPAVSNSQLNVATNATPVNQTGDAGGSIATGSADIVYRVRYRRASANVAFGASSAQASMVLYYI